MKVKIGPYVDFVRSHLFNNHLEKKYGFEKMVRLREKDYDKEDRFYDKLEDVLNFIYNKTINQILKHKKRKIKIKIDKYDSWSADHTLALIILPVLKQVRDSKHGAPFVDNEDVPEHLRATDEEVKACNEGGDTDDKFFDRWKYVMDEMIFSFENIVDDEWESQFHTGNHDIIWEPVDKDGNPVEREEAELFEMKKGPNDTHEFDVEGWKAYNARIDNGLRLFGKYYRGLWT